MASQITDESITATLARPRRPAAIEIFDAIELDHPDRAFDPHSFDT